MLGLWAGGLDTTSWADRLGGMGLGLIRYPLQTSEVVVAKNTGNGHRIGLVINRFQKFNPLTGLWDKFDKAGNYVGTKKTGGAFKSIVKLIGRNPRRP
jgi:hypothetical protein